VCQAVRRDVRSSGCRPSAKMVRLGSDSDRCLQHPACDWDRQVNTCSFRGRSYGRRVRRCRPGRGLFHFWINSGFSFAFCCNHLAGEVACRGKTNTVFCGGSFDLLLRFVAVSLYLDDVGFNSKFSGPINPMESKLPTPLGQQEITLPTKPKPSNPASFCPNCSTQLKESRCKLKCPRCGFYLSCSDFY